MENYIDYISQYWGCHWNYLLLALCIYNGRCILMVQNDISWGYAVLISLFSALIGYFIFLFIEVPYGDTLKDILDQEYQSEQYLNINIIIFSGLLIILAVSILLNLIFMRSYKLGPRLLSNLITLGLTLVILFALSGISIITQYRESYSQLDLVTQIRASLNFYAFYSIYLLPNPTWFWTIALFIYHGILIIFIKLFYVRKSKEVVS